MSTTTLPRGIWFEADRNRYRIRLYRNGRSYVRYRDTLDEALAVYQELSQQLEAIPKLARGAHAPVADLRSTSSRLVHGVY